jgi:hypothetical protein
MLDILQKAYPDWTWKVNNLIYTGRFKAGKFNLTLKVFELGYRFSAECYLSKGQYVASSMADSPEEATQQVLIEVKTSFFTTAEKINPTWLNGGNGTKADFSGANIKEANI